MALQWIDWLIIFLFFALSLGIGMAVARKAGSSVAEFFVAGRHMPWWLLGISMVATTFSADTPTLVTNFVRTQGVAGNWQWWAFLLTGMMNTFIYAKLWSRSGVLTDMEFYELRYSGKGAAFLRGFRALYLGIFFNVLIMATVSLAAVKISGALFGANPYTTLAIAAVVTVIYSMMGGLRGVIITDFFQFGLAMIGSIAAAVIVVNMPQVGGLPNLLAHDAVQGHLRILPDFSNTDALVGLLIMPLAVQWWSMWYPGSEPGGGGFVAQRMLAAKDGQHAMGATFLFQAAHYALRPWPWILIALASMVVFPDLESLREAFPQLPASKIEHDLAYPAMLTHLPPGLLGMVAASLIAAYMSTISTHLNWGSSYIVNDFYLRFVRPGATERELVRMGRISTAGLMILAILFALALTSALQAFTIILQVGAGTGLIFILRWFWWRVNAWSEIVAMVVACVVALYFPLAHERLGFAPFESWQQLLIGVTITTLAWLLTALFGPVTDAQTLRRFCRVAGPGGPGWRAVFQEAQEDGDPIDPSKAAWDLPIGIVCMVLGSVAIYSALFATGYWIYGYTGFAVATTLVAVVSSVLLIRSWHKIRIGPALRPTQNEQEQ